MKRADQPLGERDDALMDAAMQGRCQQPDCETPTAAWEAHHVLYEQHVRQAGEPRWDGRNVLRLCKTCHQRHHNRQHPVPMSALTEQNLDYVFELLGQRAYVYLCRHYTNDDLRPERRMEGLA